MDQISLQSVTKLAWSRAAAGYELRGDGVTVAQITIDGARANATSASASWLIVRDITRTIRIWNAASGDLVGEVSKSGWTGHQTVTLSNGHVYSWEPTNAWRSQWCFRCDSGSMVLRVYRGGNPIAVGGLDRLAGGVASAEIELLAIVARYLLVVSANDDGIAAAAAVIGS